MSICHTPAARRASIWMSTFDLDVMIPDHADIDGEFEALCVNTGERIRIKGWLIEDIDWLTDAPASGEA